MPKLLRKNILCSMTKLMISFVLLSAVTIFIAMSIYRKNLTDFFELIEERYVFGLLIFAVCDYAFFDSFSLPDYMFIAPYSLEGRRYMIRKAFRVSLILKFLGICVFFLTPDFVRFFLRREPQVLAGCVFQMIILFCMLYVFQYFRYFETHNHVYDIRNSIVIFVLLTFEEGILGVFAGQDPAVPGKPCIYEGIALVIGIWSIIYYYRKYFRVIVDFYADYELRTCKK